jgi:alpha-tubulin suppressor-like RCC1 family protein
MTAKGIETGPEKEKKKKKKKKKKRTNVRFWFFFFFSRVFFDSNLTSPSTPAMSVLTWGWGKHGLLGHGAPAVNEPTPRLIVALSGGSGGSGTGTASGGSSHSSGQSNDNGKGGLNGSGNGGGSDASDAHGTAPLLRASHVSHVALGWAHSVAVREGAAWSWGWSLHGQLGQGPGGP